MTDKVSAARCCLYQLFPHCVWLSRRWAAQRCPQGLERRRTGRGAWRDKNLISLQPFVASPSILPSSNPRRMTDWYYRYTDMKSFLFSLQSVWCRRDRKVQELSLFLLCFSRDALQLRKGPREGYFLTLHVIINVSTLTKIMPVHLVGYSQITWS